MSNTTTTTRRSTLARLGIGTGVAASLAAATLALWPASEADKARDDGERLGAAVSELYYADTSDEVDAALGEIRDAASDTREHAGDSVAEQADKQADALDRAVDGYVGAVETGDEFEAELYEAELDVALDDLESNASDFRDEGPEVVEAFGEGVQNELPES